MIDASGGVSPAFAADYQALKANVTRRRIAGEHQCRPAIAAERPVRNSGAAHHIAALESVPTDPNKVSPVEVARATAALQARVAALGRARLQEPRIRDGVGHRSGRSRLASAGAAEPDKTSNRN